MKKKNPLVGKDKALYEKLKRQNLAFSILKFDHKIVVRINN